MPSRPVWFGRPMLMVAFISLLASLAPVIPTAPSLAAENETLDLIPLGRRCTTELPPGSATTICCMFGSVYIDGEAVEGARVTIAGARDRVVVFTERETALSTPGYGVNLTSEISVQIGETITITVEHSNHRYSMSYQVLGGSQQVDIVVPVAALDGYVFANEMRSQGEPGTLLEPAGLAVSPSGHVYVTDLQNARVQVFNTQGIWIDGWGDRSARIGDFVEPTGLAVGADDRLFVADTLNARVQGFSTNGDLPFVIDGANSSAGKLGSPYGVALDKDGNLYVTDTSTHRLRVFDRNGVALHSWGGYGDGPGEFSQPTGVAVDSAGTIYVAEAGNHRIQKLSPTGQPLGFVGELGTTSGKFTRPWGVAVDLQRNLYVADRGNHRIQKFSPAGSHLGTWGGEGSGAQQLREPRGVAVDAQGVVYIADTGNHRIQRIASSGGWLSGWGSKSRNDGQFNDPHGVDVNSEGELFIADTGNHRVQVFDRDGNFLRSWGEFGTDPGEFRFPYGVAVAPDDTVYVTDSLNQRVQQFRRTGEPIRSWGSPGSGEKQFNRPRGIAISQNGDVYVADRDNHRVQQFDATGNFIRMWGEQGGQPEQFEYPIDVAVSKNGDVYVVDEGNHRVQRFSLSGEFRGLWGGQGTADDRFNFTAGVDVDAAGNVYVADRCNYRIKKFSPSGSLLSRWGGFGYLAGQFHCLSGVAVADNGLVYVSDAGGDRVHQFRPRRFTRPIASVVGVATATGDGSITKGENLTLYGVGGVSLAGAGPLTFQWTLDGANTPFATTSGETFSEVTLPTSGADFAPGLHRISLRVRDNTGQFSDQSTITVIVSPPPPVTRRSWTFILYLSGDNRTLAPTLNEVTGAVSKIAQGQPNANVRIVGLYDGPGGNDSFRFAFDQQNRFTWTFWNEVSMGDPYNLVRLIEDARQQAPADHYYLAIADHANALYGIIADETSRPIDTLTNSELRTALEDATDNGALPIDVLHLDGCLMGIVEVAYQVNPFVDYLIVSQNLGWSTFAYESYRQLVQASTEPRKLATDIVATYSAQLEADGRPYTISALDVSATPDVTYGLSILASDLIRYIHADVGPRQATLQAIRTEVQKLDSDGDYDLDQDDYYVDLSHLVSLIDGKISDSAVDGSARALSERLLPDFIVANGSDSGVIKERGLEYTVSLENARGIGIYFPERTSRITYGTYQELVFARDNAWDDFLSVSLSPANHDARPEAPPLLVPPLTVPRSQIALPLLMR